MSTTIRMERRLIPFDRIEIRAREGGGKVLIGHAAVFDKDSEDLYGFTERVAPGTFALSIKEDDIRALFNHNPDYVLGRNVAKTLRLEEDKVGLSMEIDLPDTQVARDLSTSVERGDITGASFSFATREDKWTYNEKAKKTTRTLLDARLYDVGPVTFPAYPDTDVAMRSLMQQIASEGRAQIEAAHPGAWRSASRSRDLALTELE